MSLRWMMTAIGAGLLFLVAGCGTRNLLFTTYTTIGLDVSATDAKPTKAMFGFKRFEGAIIPVNPQQEQDNNDGTKKGPDVASVYAAIDLDNHWTGLTVCQVFATGQPAKNLANNSDGLEALFGAETECWKASSKDGTPPAGTGDPRPSVQ